MVARLVLLAACCSLLGLGVQGSTDRRSGPYDFQLEKIDKCPDSGSDESVFPTRLTKVSRDRVVLNDTFRLYPAMDEDTKAIVEFQQWGNQGYRPRAFMLVFKTCNKILKECDEILKQLFGAAGFNITGCPIPAGNYTTHNLAMELRPSRMPVMMYSKYRVLINLFHANRKVGCARFYTEYMPKGGV